MRNIIIFWAMTICGNIRCAIVLEHNNNNNIIEDARGKRSEFFFHGIVVCPALKPSGARRYRVTRRSAARTNSYASSSSSSACNRLRVDGACGVALGHLFVRRGVDDPRSSVPQTAAGEHRAGPGTRRTGSAEHDGVPPGHELHVRTAQDGRVPGRSEPLGPDTAARRLRDRGPDPAGPIPVAGHQRTAFGRPRPQQRRISVCARQRRGR